jgi:N-methylhydantoinase A
VELDVAAAERAIRAQVGQPLGLSVEEAAEAILGVVNSNMAGALRLQSVAKGKDPRRLTLIAFGGAGPLHAAELAAQLGSQELLIPRWPGVMSALGCATAAVRHDFVTTVNWTLAAAGGTERMSEVFDAHYEQARGLLAAEGHGASSVAVVHSADMSYVPQSRLITAPLGEAALSNAGIRLAFEGAYQARYGTIILDGEVRVTNLRSSVTIRRDDIERPEPSSNTFAVGPVEKRRIRCGGERRVADVFDQRDTDVPEGYEIHGPAVIERTDGTIFVPPGWRLSSDRGGNFSLGVSK